MAKFLKTFCAAAVAGLVATSAFAADKSLTPDNKPAPASPHAKPGSQAAEDALKAAVTPYQTVEEVFSGSETVAGEKLAFPKDSASVQSFVVTLSPGEKTAWHQHHAPLFAYVLEGEVTVTYDVIGKKVYRAGDGYLEAMKVTQQGANTGDAPAKVLAVYLLGEGDKPTVLEQAPGENKPAIQ